ncbi:sugar ABC transporter ATP-binding protein [Megalodesulfovibrio gigas]|uniref:Putative ABC transporter n=1 Tax=Megalodesulfovibrio gigas (strain ATCC 19364 / DSM 1382 / NCIMB 9332 / VKM B-1759) TaxID=1121448 RepID=T2GG99_MEGG1|nr:sugar ABC transporter ATP-binding protein [Megalodesulfovibrio gigas]AGW15022.1 putative ABC transporter [Megalodesulfovibrio gigas DSM 1382 = ATCC 19364]
MPRHLLELRHISKSFGHTHALRGVHLTVAPGEIHGLLGMNGSGKSTLLHILAGHPCIQLGHGRGSRGFQGEIRLQGQAFSPRSPAEAMARGVGMIHQESVLLPEFTVGENIALGREVVRPWTARVLGRRFAALDRERNDEGARLAMQQLGLEMSPATRTGALSLGRKLLVEVARELINPNLRLLLLDEPTSALDEEDTRRLHACLRTLAANGVGIVYVSHRLQEVFALCHRATILRDGEVVAEAPGGAFDVGKICELMTSRPLRTAQPSLHTQRLDDSPPLLRLRNFRVDMPGEPLRNMTLDVRQGEMIGLAGLTGHGRPALGRGLFGLCPTGGQALFGQSDTIDLCTDAGRRKACDELAYIPEDRRQMGLLLQHSVQDNLTFSVLHRRGRFLRPFPVPALRWCDERAARRFAEECVQTFGIRCASVRQPVSQLSGGNQQKLCIARALASSPRLLLVSEPVRGIDVEAKEAILGQLLRSNTKEGLTIIMASSELDTLQRCCTRIVVLHEGRLQAVLPSGTDEQIISRCMCGVAGEMA